MPAELKPVTVPALAVDVGFFSTKYTLGRAVGKDSNKILVTQFPSVTPRIFNGIGSLPITASLDGVAVCDQIHPGLKDDSEIVDRVDLALRQGAKTVKITGRNHEMQQYWPAVKGVLQDAIEQMQKSVGSLRSIDAILLTGGGAKLLAKVASDTLPEFSHLMEVDANPVESNVRGLRIIAELYSA